MKTEASSCPKLTVPTLLLALLENFFIFTKTLDSELYIEIWKLAISY